MTAKKPTPTPAKRRTRRTRKGEPAGAVAGIAASARGLAGQAGDVASGLVDRLPVDAVKGGALDALRTVETMPRPQRRRMTILSLGIGAVLYLLGAPRLLTFLAFIPALAVGGTRIARGHLGLR